MEKILSKITEANEELSTFLKKLKEENLKLLENTEKASNAYSADIIIRKKKIEEQIAGLKERKREISDTLEDIKLLFMNATTEGDTEGIQKLQKQMADLKAEETNVDAQIEFLYTTPITGNQELFDIASELNDKLRKNSDDFRIVYKSLIKIAEYWQNVWAKLYDEFLWTNNPGAFSSEYAKILEYHRNCGKCIEKPVENNAESEPINMETNCYIFGQEPQCDENK